MYRKLIITIAVLALITAACAPVIQNPAESPTVTGVSPDDPVTGVPGETSEPTGDSWKPQPGDEQLIRQEVEIERAEILTLESFPPQFTIHITGTKGNPCALLRIETGEPDPEGRIDIDVYVLVDPAAICTQVLESFDVNVPLGSLPGGEYTVYVNGEMVGEIIAPQT